MARCPDIRCLPWDVGREGRGPAETNIAAREFNYKRNPPPLPLPKNSHTCAFALSLYVRVCGYAFHPNGIFLSVRFFCFFFLLARRRFFGSF